MSKAKTTTSHLHTGTTTPGDRSTTAVATKKATSSSRTSTVTPFHYAPKSNTAAVESTTTITSSEYTYEPIATTVETIDTPTTAKTCCNGSITCDTSTDVYNKGIILQRFRKEITKQKYNYFMILWLLIIKFKMFTI